MRKFYGTLGAIAALELILGSLVSFATPSSEYTASRLAGHPEQWKITVLNENEFFFRKEDEDQMKASLLDFIALSRSPTLSKIHHFQVGVAIVFLFCIIGFFREKQIFGNRNRKSA